MRRILVLLTAVVVALAMVAGPVLAAPHKKPEPPKKHHKVCVQWKKIVKWDEKKYQIENKYYWVKAKKAYKYVNFEGDWGLPEDKAYAFKVVKLPKGKCAKKAKKDYPNPKYKLPAFPVNGSTTATEPTAAS